MKGYLFFFVCGFIRTVWFVKKELFSLITLFNLQENTRKEKLPFKMKKNPFTTTFSL